MKYKKAFTLIEMLVVISLIGILAALALVSFGGAQKQARDTTRKSDLKQYQTAIESYASKNNGSYPLHSTAITITTGATFCGATELNIGSCINDPKDPTLQYKYISNAAQTDYAVWATLENKTTTTYWISCANGRVGEKTTAPTLALICPL